MTRPTIEFHDLHPTPDDLAAEVLADAQRVENEPPGPELVRGHQQPGAVALRSVDAPGHGFGWDVLADPG